MALSGILGRCAPAQCALGSIGTASLLASGPADQTFTTTPVKATFDAPASFVFTVTRTTSG